jgi:hypothetical protein
MSLSLAKPLPKGAEYLADVAAKAGADNGISPYLLLGICYAESNFGAALKPPGPTGTGDFIPRVADKDTNEKMAKNPLPGVEKKVLPDGIKARKVAGPVEAWVPTHTGWGCGLLQFDYEAHYEFCKSGAWKEPAKVFDQACKLLKGNRSFLAKKHPELTGIALDRAMIASYNAGAGRVSKFLTDKKSLDECTFHPGYIDKICKKADEFAGASGAFATPSTAPVA